MNHNPKGDHDAQAHPRGDLRRSTLDRSSGSGPERQDVQEEPGLVNTPRSVGDEGIDAALDVIYRARLEQEWADE